MPDIAALMSRRLQSMSETSLSALLDSTSSRASLVTLCSYLPSTILHFLDSIAPEILEGSAVPPLRHTWETAVLFADVSGFTNMSERLSQNSTGAEDLARIINAYFGQLVKVVGRHGGDVFKFAGDAIIVLWPSKQDEDICSTCRRAGQCALEIQNSLHNIQFQDQDHSQTFALSLKIGIGVGQCCVVHMGGITKRLEFVATGAPLTQAFSGEARAQSGQVVLSPEAARLLSSFFKLSPMKDDYAMVHACTDPLTKKGIAKTMQLPAVFEVNTAGRRYLEKIVKLYVPPSVLPFVNDLEERWASEIRRVVVLFISVGLSATDLAAASHGDEGCFARMQSIMVEIQNAVYKFEGSINKFLLDDKGCTMLAVFGLPPYAHENDSARGVMAALSICSQLHSIGISPSVGVTTGRAFCGVTGGQTRREYSVLGEVVNLSARLMQHAVTNQLCIACDNETQYSARHKIAFQPLDSVQLKGKSTLTKVYLPSHWCSMRRSKAFRDLPSPELDGRRGDKPKGRFAFRFSVSPSSAEKQDQQNQPETVDCCSVTSKLSGTIRDSFNEPESRQFAKMRFKPTFTPFNLQCDIDSFRTKDRTPIRFSRVQPSVLIRNPRVKVHEELMRRFRSPRRNGDRPAIPLSFIDDASSPQNRRESDSTIHQVQQAELKIEEPTLRTQSLPPVRADFLFLGNQKSAVSTIRVDLHDGEMPLSFAVDSIRFVKEAKVNVATYFRNKLKAKLPSDEELIFVSARSKIPIDDDLRLDVVPCLLWDVKADDELCFSLISKTASVTKQARLDGRENFRLQLARCLQELLENGTSRLIFVEGEIGNGKTRLLASTLCDSPTMVLCTVADSLLGATPFSVWKQLLAQILDHHINRYPELYDSAPMVNRRNLLRSRLEVIPDSAALCPVLNSVLEFGFLETEATLAMAEAAREAALINLMVRIFQQFTLQEPIVAVIDDGNAIDHASWSLLSTMVEQVRGFVIAVALRPINQSNSDLGSVHAQSTELTRSTASLLIKLERLPDSIIYGIACDALSVHTLPAKVKSKIIRHSMGNPLVCKELVYALTRQGLLKFTRSKGTGTQPACFASKEFRDDSYVPIPVSLQQILGAKLDRLSIRKRMILKTGSVIGPEFDFELLQSAYPFRESASTLACELEELCELQLLQKHEPLEAERHDQLHRGIAGLSKKQTNMYFFAVGFLNEFVRSTLLHAQIVQVQRNLPFVHADQYSGMMQVCKSIGSNSRIRRMRWKKLFCVIDHGGLALYKNVDPQPAEVPYKKLHFGSMVIARTDASDTVHEYVFQCCSRKWEKKGIVMTGQALMLFALPDLGQLKEWMYKLRISILFSANKGLGLNSTDNLKKLERIDSIEPASISSSIADRDTSSTVSSSSFSAVQPGSDEEDHEYIRMDEDDNHENREEFIFSSDDEDVKLPKTQSVAR